MMIAERLEMEREEFEKIQKNIFSGMQPLKLKVYSSKEKKKLVALQTMIEQFEMNRKYTEKEINEVLQAIWPDYATVRRDLFEYGYLARTKDCKEYWRK